MLLIGTGILVFTIGTFTWFYGKIKKKKIFKFWIYKYSRHPQYLGFLVWSYGFMLLAYFQPVPFGGQNPGASFPWLVSAILIICVALFEEIKMSKLAGKEYSEYRENSPFMLPLPKTLSKLITAPNRLFLKKNFPDRKREVFYTFLTYVVVLVLLSLLALVSTGILIPF